MGSSNPRGGCQEKATSKISERGGALNLVAAGWSKFFYQQACPLSSQERKDCGPTGRTAKGQIRTWASYSRRRVCVGQAALFTAAQ